jgi:hypothetical protein
MFCKLRWKATKLAYQYFLALTKLPAPELHEEDHERTNFSPRVKDAALINPKHHEEIQRETTPPFRRTPAKKRRPSHNKPTRDRCFISCSQTATSEPEFLPEVRAPESLDGPSVRPAYHPRCRAERYSTRQEERSKRLGLNLPPPQFTSYTSQQAGA